MNRAELKRIQKALLERKMEILDKLLEEHETYVQHLKSETGDLADEAYDVIERDLAYDLSLAEKNELEEINAALKKIEEGTYGICEDCGEKIPLERLKIKPYARYCVKCKEKRERRKILQPTIDTEEE